MDSPTRTLEQAQDHILRTIKVTHTEMVPLAQAHGRVAGSDIHAPVALPTFSNSAMDGYAVRSQDLEGASVQNPVALHQAALVSAGMTPPSPLLPKTTHRIFTGAMLPQGADAVVMQEVVQCEGATITFTKPAPPGLNVRPAGSDIASGSRIVARGQRLKAGEVGALAALGCSVVEVFRKPRVAIIACGDELLRLDEAQKPGQLRDSNSPMLAAMMAEQGCITTCFPIVPDSKEALRSALLAACQGNDLIVTTGGVSVGDFDYVKSVLEDIGHVDFWRLAIKPGKPVLFGNIHETPLLGAPGNPVSSFVCTMLLCIPALRKMAGCADVEAKTTHAKLMASFAGGRQRREFLRCTLHYQGHDLCAVPLKNQGSGQHSSLLGIDGLIDLPSGEAPVSHGTSVRIILF